MTKFLALHIVCILIIKRNTIFYLPYMSVFYFVHYNISKKFSTILNTGTSLNSSELKKSKVHGYLNHLMINLFTTINNQC